MTPERYQQVKAIFAAACQQPPAARAAYVAQACADDAELQAEVDSLLAHDETSLPFSPVISAAAVLEAVRLDAGAADSGSWPPAASAAGELLPERIGRYRIVRKLGQGGMGAVFEAEQDNPRRTVALKIIRPGFTSEQLLRRFRLEAQVLGRLQHPGIAQVYEAGTADMPTADGPVLGQPFFAMELVRGQPLIEFVRAHHLDVRRRLELLAKVCDAVEHAHQHGVIHRDLKPGNILVDDSGQPKILDFGVARVIDSDMQMTTLRTDVRQLIGTMAYMSPEQVTGDRQALDTRSDVYALGVLAFQLLAERLPYELSHMTIPEAVRTIAEEEPTPLNAINRVFRGDLSTIVAKALEKDKQRRYASAAELASDIRRYLSDEPISARRPTAFYHLRKFARRNPAVVAAVFTTFAALVVGIAGTTSQAVRAVRERNRALAAEQMAEQRQAEAEAQRTEAQRQATIAQAVNDFLTDDLLAAANPEKGREPLVTVRDVLDRAAAVISDRFRDAPLVEASVRTTLGDAYRALGEYDLAEPQLSQAVALRQAALGDDDPLTLSSRHLLGCLYSSQARFNEAETLLLDVLARRQRVLGPDHRATLATMNVLALLHGRQGRDADEERLLLQTLDAAQRTLTQDDEAVLVARGNLADLYSRIQRLDDAELLYVQNVDALRRTRSDDHYLTLANMSNLANLYARQRRYAEAEPLCSRTLEIRRRLLGDDHPRTLASLNGLAVLYKQQGCYVQAEPLFVQALDAKRRTLGDDHPSTLVALNNLANLYAVLERHAEAECLFLQTIEARRRILGDNHPQTRSTVNNLVEFYQTQGRADEAQRWLAQLAAMPAAPKASRVAADDD